MCRIWLPEFETFEPSPQMQEFQLFNAGEVFEGLDRCGRAPKKNKTKRVTNGIAKNVPI